MHRARPLWTACIACAPPPPARASRTASPATRDRDGHRLHLRHRQALKHLDWIVPPKTTMRGGFETGDVRGTGLEPRASQPQPALLLTLTPFGRRGPRWRGSPTGRARVRIRTPTVRVRTRTPTVRILTVRWRGSPMGT